MIPDAKDIVNNTIQVMRSIGPDEERLADSRCARGISAIYKRYLKYSIDAEKWRYWDGIRWQADSADAVINRATIDFVVDSVFPKMKKITNYEKSRMLGDRYLSSVARQLKLLQHLHVREAAFDADAWIIGTPEGAVDLRIGKKFKPKPEHMISMQTGCEPADRGEPSPQYDAFMEFFTCAVADLVRFFNMWGGLGLIGNNADQKMLFMHGDSQNGKSVFLELAGLVAGEYHRTMSMGALMVRSGGGDTNSGLASIIDGRMATGSEIPKGAEWDTQAIKQLCSTENVSLRKLYANVVTLPPRCSVMLAGNDLPAMTGLDEAIRNRFEVVECKAKVKPADRRDHYARELFEAEGPQILRRFIDGAVDRWNNGYRRPIAVQEASQEYFDNEDVVATWVHEEYEDDPEGQESTMQMYLAWQEYNRALGRPRDLTMTAFVLRLKKMGYETIRTKKARFIKGLRKKSFAGL